MTGMEMMLAKMLGVSPEQLAQAANQFQAFMQGFPAVLNEIRASQLRTEANTQAIMRHLKIPPVQTTEGTGNDDNHDNG